VRESLHDQPVFDYASYAFNGEDNSIRMSAVGPWKAPGLTDVKLSAVVHPARTVLVAEASAIAPWSWHEPRLKPAELLFNDAKNMASFVDGHAGYVRIYWNSRYYLNGAMSFALQYDPPVAYDYQWSGN